MKRSRVATVPQLTTAWETLLGDFRPDLGGVLQRQQLDSLFRALTAEADPVEAVALDDAYDFLSALLGERSVVLVMPVQDELSQVSVPRLTPPGSVAESMPSPRFAPFTAALPVSARAPVLAPASAPLREPSEPQRPLFGRYLLAEGYITLSELTAAILWQRAQRPAVGQIAVDWRILTREQVALILRQKGTAEMFCDHAVRMGMMSGFQRLAVLAKQRRLQRPIGAYFVERGILTQAQVDALARRVGGATVG